MTAMSARGPGARVQEMSAAAASGTRSIMAPPGADFALPAQLRACSVTIRGCPVRALPRRLADMPVALPPHPLLAVLRDLLAPPACLACGGPGHDLCAGCRRELPFLRGPCCPRCALPLPCGRRCPARLAPFAASWAPVAHAGPARELVAALKFR